jgi:hypothetical protein
VCVCVCGGGGGAEVQAAVREGGRCQGAPQARVAAQQSVAHK